MADETIKWEFLIDDKGSRVMGDFDSKTRKSMNSLSSIIKSKLGGAFSGLGKTIKSVYRNVFSLRTGIIALGTGLAIRSLNRAVSGFEELAKTQEQAEAGLRQVLKSMNRFSEAKFEGLKDLASGLQAASTFGDEAIISGIKFLATYKQISDDALPRTAQAMVDLAALTGRDMPTAANILGKAAMGLTGELRRYGITIDEDVAASGDFLKILGQIETQIQGQAAALRETKSGGIEAFGNVIGDVKEKFGLFTSEIKSKIAELALPWVEKLNDRLGYWIKSGEMERMAVIWSESIVKSAKTIVETTEVYFAKFRDLVGKLQSWWDKVKKQWEEVKRAVGEGISITGPGISEGLGGTGVIRGKMPARPEYGSITDLTTGKTMTFSDLPKAGAAGGPQQAPSEPGTASIYDPRTGKTYSINEAKGNQITVNMTSTGSVAQDALTVRKELENLEKRGY